MKYVITALVLAVLLFPRAFLRLLRAAGRLFGDLGRAGKELATGEEVKNSPLAKYEVRAGELVALKLLTKYPSSGDAGLQHLVASLGSRLARHAMRREIPYRFTAVESEEPNAFAVPGGTILIARSLVELCEGQPDRIAGVLAHEVVHVDRRHAVRVLAATTAVRAGFRFLPLGRAAFLSRLSLGMEELIVQGYRQDQELEADALGVRLARLAGFEPWGLLRLLELLHARVPAAKGALAELRSYFGSHPPFELRRKNLTEAIASLEAC